jgi:Tfp pilus assembly protein FimT
LSDFSKRIPCLKKEAGLGLMEVIVGLLVTMIVGSILLHLGRTGFSMYKLNSAVGGITEELDLARHQALTRRASVSVIFHANEKVFGIDRNGNGRLEAVEAEELPDGVVISEDVVVTFSRSGSLATGSNQPNIVISTTAKSRRVSVSKSGAIEID